MAFFSIFFWNHSIERLCIFRCTESFFCIREGQKTAGNFHRFCRNIPAVFSTPSGNMQHGLQPCCTLRGMYSIRFGVLSRSARHRIGTVQYLAILYHGLQPCCTLRGMHSIRFGVLYAYFRISYTVPQNTFTAFGSTCSSKSKRRLCAGPASFVRTRMKVAWPPCSCTRCIM